MKKRKISTINDQIKLLEESFNFLDEEKTYELYSKRISHLRKHVFNIHGLCETQLEIFLLFNIFKHLNFNFEKLGQFKILPAVSMLIEEVDFTRKLKLLKDLNFLAEKNLNCLFKLNELRVLVAHPSAKWYKLNKFNDDDNYLKALKILEESLTISYEMAKKTKVFIK